MNKIFVVLLIGLLLVSCVSAMSIDFYYSENCPHCKQVYPFVLAVSKYYPINFIDVNQGSYNIQGVPLIRILTSDKRNIELTGSQEIPKLLSCELNEQSTLDCPTTSILNCETNSFFIR